MTPAEMVRFYERRATKAEAVVHAVAMVHHAEGVGRRKTVCAECGVKWPCRTSRIVSER